jgi:hypothetical protein
MPMVRTVYVKGKEYYVITTTLEAGKVSSPVQIHINVSELSSEDKILVQKHANLLLNHTFKVPPHPKPKSKVKKAWYRFW